VPEYRKVLITGVTGLIGGIAFRELGKDYELSGLARRPMEGLRHFRASIHVLDDILPAFEGQDAVVHLAADPSDHAPWESVLPNNIIGTYNVFEACRIHGVKRVVFASSNHATGMYERDHPYRHIVRGEYDKVDTWPIPLISHTSEIRPDGYYGISKAYGEAMGRYYCEQYGISVICMRIGTVRPFDRPTQSIRHFATWLSHRDQAQLIRKSLEAPTELGFDIFYGVSDNKWRFWDIEHAREVIGYDPQDNAEDYRGQEES
jgi:nucleoside-diphosphate-sugar epimerase